MPKETFVLLHNGEKMPLENRTSIAKCYFGFWSTLTREYDSFELFGGWLTRVRIIWNLSICYDLFDLWWGSLNDLMGVVETETIIKRHYVCPVRISNS